MPATTTASACATDADAARTGPIPIRSTRSGDPGRLSAFGVSPWQFGLAVGAALFVVAAVSIGALQALSWWRARGAERVAVAGAKLAAVLSVALLLVSLRGSGWRASLRPDPP